MENYKVYVPLKIGGFYEGKHGEQYRFIGLENGELIFQIIDKGEETDDLLFVFHVEHQKFFNQQQIRLIAFSEKRDKELPMLTPGGVFAH